jgi:hypothetical protein
MRREVNVYVQDVPFADLLGQLSLSAGVPIALSAGAGENLRAHADLRGLRLHEALEKVAEAAGLIVAPQGSGLLVRPRGLADVGLPLKHVWSRDWGSAPQTQFTSPPKPVLPNGGPRAPQGESYPK